MLNFYPFIKYTVNDTVYENSRSESEHYTLETAISDGRIRCVLKPKTKMHMIEFCLSAVKKMADDEVFFANGYQSWTTSREYRRGDTVNGAAPITGLIKLSRDLAEVSGDYKFTNYGERGNFHSFTYTYFRRGGKLEFFGSLNERTGYTIFDYKADANAFKIIKDVDGLAVDGEYELFDVVCLEGEYDAVFDDYFKAMALAKPRLSHLSGYTSWYNYFQKINEKIILRDLDGLDRAKDEVSIFQIDDGYETYVGDWLTPDAKKFPNGMKYIADAIHEKGYLAGIWIAPFSAQRVSAIAKEHPDWLLKDESGKPVLGCFAWGGAYTLDMYNPQVREHIKHFFDVILNEWGFDMVKLDFLYSEAAMPRNGKTRGTIMTEAMEFLRECVGSEKLILGCGVPLGPAFGYVDACRISCDVDLKYKGKYYNKLALNRELPSAQNAITSTIFRRHLNGRAFCSDPDVFFLRNHNLKFTMEQKLLLGKINNLCGDVLFISDDAGEYSEDEIGYLKSFFKQSDAEIQSAEFTSAGEIAVKFTEDGKNRELRFDLGTGASNILEIIK